MVTTTAITDGIILTGMAIILTGMAIAITAAGIGVMAADMDTTAAGAVRPCHNFDAGLGNKVAVPWQR